MAKNFKNNTALTNLTATSTTHIVQEPKKRVGRPATKNVKETCRKTCIAIPNELMEKWDDIKVVHGSNLTGYIIKLIEKDMEENYAKYKDIVNTLNNL